MCEIKPLNERARADLLRYLGGYPGRPDCPGKDLNLKFYRNEMPFQPNGILLSELLEKWEGDYDKLEQHHQYIQWLFPIREQGMNDLSQPMQEHELASFREDPELMERALRSLRFILRFYGMQLTETGVERSDSPLWEGLYHNLNESTHNQLRITRILKFLGDLGLEELQLALLRHIKREIYEHGRLGQLRSGLHTYWTMTVRGEAERARLVDELSALAMLPPPECTRAYAVADDNGVVVGNFAAVGAGHAAVRDTVARLGQPPLVVLTGESHDERYVAAASQQCQQLGLDHRAAIVPDGEGAFERMAADVCALRATEPDRPLLLLCRTGVGTSCAFAVALAMQQGKSVLDALTDLRSIVPLARPGTFLFKAILRMEEETQRRAGIEPAPSLPMHTFMGMTLEQYQEWLKPPACVGGAVMDDGKWSCGACTLINPAGAGACSVCGTLRPKPQPR